MLKLIIKDENDDVIYEGFAEHFSPLISAIVGYDEVNKTWMPVGITDKGYSKTANYIWNPNTLAWEVATGGATPGENVTITNFPSDQLIHGKTDPYDYTLRMDTVGAIIYIGKAIVGSDGEDAVWQIKSIDSTVGLVILWADGNNNFDNIWGNHTDLDYS